VHVPLGHSLFVLQNCTCVRPEGQALAEHAVLAVLLKRSNDPQQTELPVQSSAPRQ